MINRTVKYRLKLNGDGGIGLKRVVCFLMVVLMLVLTAGCKGMDETGIGSSVIYEEVVEHITEIESNSQDTLQQDNNSVNSSTTNKNESNSASQNPSVSSDSLNTTSSADNNYINPFEPHPSGDYIIKNNSTPESYADTITVNDKKYNYVWGDEFNSDTIDHGPQYYDNEPIKSGKIWDTTGMLPWFSDVSIPSNIEDRMKYNYVKDGELVMKAGCYDWTDSVKSYNGKDVTSLDYAMGGVLTTRQTMVYRRGYAEIRAKLPFKNGAWPAWWLRSTGSDLIRYPDGTTQYDPIFTLEVDVFETWTYLGDTIYPTIHKFYNNTYDGSAKRVYDYNNKDITDKIIGSRNDEGHQFSVKASRNTFNLSNPEDYHTYGFLWTDTEMVFFVDGIDYFVFDLTESFDGYSDGRYDYNQYMYFLFDMYMITPGATWGGTPEQRYTGTGDTADLEMSVEYIRLWQESGKEDIIFND